MSELPNSEIGCTIPFDDEHAITSWNRRWATVEGFIAGDKEIVDKIIIEYPRYVIHRIINSLRTSIVSRYGNPDTDDCLPYPSVVVAKKCVEWIVAHADTKHPSLVRAIEIGPFSENAGVLGFGETLTRWTTFCAVVCRKEDYPVLYAFWQIRGQGMSSRNAELVLPLFEAGVLGMRDEKAEIIEEIPIKLPIIPDGEAEKEVIRKRIAGFASVGHEENPVKPDDVFLCQSGMGAMAQSQDILIEASAKDQKRLFLEVGFPYCDTMWLLENWGPGRLFYGHASEEEVDEIENRLKKGEAFAGLYVEAPGNPLLLTTNLERLRKLSLEYGFPVVIDDTIGSWVNVDSLRFADIVVTSLSKSFNGACNVLAGSVLLNPESPHYSLLKPILERVYEDKVYPLDAIVLEENSRDYWHRAQTMSANAEATADFFLAHPLIRDVKFPKFTKRQNFDQVRRDNGRFGMVLTVVFHTKDDAVVFYDYLETFKGASLGTNFTLAIPFVTLAFSRKAEELKHAIEHGNVEESVRLSVGLEDIELLKEIFTSALEKVREAKERKV